MSHTPRPWKINKSTLDIGSLPNGMPICTINVASGAGWHDKETAEANASLIAAAPELLEITKKMLAYFNVQEDEINFSSMVHEAASIIAKAEGK